MRIELLKTALKVHELKSFSAVGEALYMTQANVSLQISALEREVGFRLFERGNGLKTVETTDRGTVFLFFASQAVKLLDEGGWKSGVSDNNR